MIKDCFFTLISGSTTKYSCKLCSEAGGVHKIEVKPGSGYTNFKNHLTSKLHSGVWRERFEAYQARLLSTDGTSSSDKIFAAAAAEGGSSIVHHLVPKYGAKTLLVYGILEMLIDCKTVI